MKVRKWDVEEGYDSTGDFAFWVWITVDDDLLNRENRNRLRDLVKEKVRNLEPGKSPWMYVRFRGASEVTGD